MNSRNERITFKASSLILLSMLSVSVFANAFFLKICSAAPEGSTKEKAISKKKKQKRPAVMGRCNIVENFGNPITTPCINFLLVLNDENGIEQSRTRTTGLGDFDFNAEPNKTYTIASGSHYFEVLSPKDLIQPNKFIDLKLQQRKADAKP